MKKRTLAIVLTVVMALALAVPSFALTMPTAATTPHALVVDETPDWTHDPVVHQNLTNSPNLVKVYHNGLYGYVNALGQTVVQTKYTEIGNFSAVEGLAWAKKNDVAVYVNNQGTEVISVGVATPHDFHNGLARITEANGNTYFIDTTGHVVFNLGQETAGEFDDNFGLNWVRTVGGKYGIINKLGQEVNHFTFDTVSINANNQLNFNSNLVRVTNGGVVYFLNNLGATAFGVTNPSVAWVDDQFSNGMCLVKDAHGQVGYIDTTGYLAVYCQYEDGERFNALGIARIKRGGLYGYINRINAYAVQPQYTELYAPDAATGLALARRYSVNYNTYKYGYVNVYTGGEQIAFMFDHARGFSEGLAYVDVIGAHNLIKGFINAAGNVVFDCTFYDELGDFHDSLAYAVKNGKYGYINKLGNVAITARYDVSYTSAGVRDYTGAPYDFENGLAVIRLADFSYASRYGIVNTSGVELYTPTFSEVLFFNPAADSIALFQYGGVNNAIVTLTR